jgi:HEPN domain-containing protein
MKDPVGESARWMDQAEYDLVVARDVDAIGHHAHACYLCQQAAEKALKALLYRAGERQVFGHSVVELLSRVARIDGGFVALGVAAGALDKLYIPTRYPNGLPGGVPTESYSADDAVEALAHAAAVVGAAEAVLRHSTDSWPPAPEGTGSSSPSIPEEPPHA